MKPDTHEWFYVASAISFVFNLVLGWAVYRLNKLRYQEDISVRPDFAEEQPDDGSLLTVRLRLECQNRVGIESVRLCWSRGTEHLAFRTRQGEENCVLDKDNARVIFYPEDVAPLDIEIMLSHSNLRLEVYSASSGRRPLRRLSGRTIRDMVTMWLKNQNAYYARNGYDRSLSHPEPYITPLGTKRTMGGPDDPFFD